jgi:maleylacetate reductase
MARRLQTNEKIKPQVVIYDVDLTLTLPVGLSMTSSVNAIAHAGMFAPLPCP